LDQATIVTCGHVRCGREMTEESYKVFRDDFRAKYIYLQKKVNPRLCEYLESDAIFKNVFENGEDAAFEVFDSKIASQAFTGIIFLKSYY
jgi:hypothetical protein